MNGEFIGDDDGAGNRKFDAKLRENSVEWGLRDVNDLNRLASYALAWSRKRILTCRRTTCCSSSSRCARGRSGASPSASCEVLRLCDMRRIACLLWRCWDKALPWSSTL